MRDRRGQCSRRPRGRPARPCLRARCDRAIRRSVASTRPHSAATEFEHQFAAFVNPLRHLAMGEVSKSTTSIAARSSSESRARPISSQSDPQGQSP